MRLRLALLGCLCSLGAWAMPETFEVWFLSPDAASASLESSGLDPRVRSVGGELAQASLQCQPMGDYCFDPQIGMYKPGDKGTFAALPDYSEVDKQEKYEYVTSGKEREAFTFECDENNHFDFFCSKESPAPKETAKLEVWIDISSSMRHVDPSAPDDMCMRESFLRRLNADCSFNSEMKVYGFNESFKELGTMQSACLNYGLNSRDALIQKIKTSKAKRLIVITDIFEADKTFATFIETSGRGGARGLDKPMYASGLKDRVSALVKKCL